MRRTSGFIIKTVLLLACHLNLVGQEVTPPDTVVFPLRIRAGIEVVGPVVYCFDKNNLNAEAFISCDFNHKAALFIGAGFSDYRYSQYNYNFSCKGTFFRAGADFNLIRPEMSRGKYQAGVGLHYGISSYISETPWFRQDNYWGSASSSIPSLKHLGHLIEITPGFKAELIKNFSIGWSVSVRRIISAGNNEGIKPIFIPGFGNGGKTISAAINYFIVWSIPYRAIKVPLKIEDTGESDDTEESPAGEKGRRDVSSTLQ
jgi:hypothetical protein